MKKLLSLALLSSVICPLPAMAAIYYIDADGGNNDNDGTSPESAWATLDKASSVTYQPGDQILLQSGDTFPGKLLLSNQTGAAGQPIVVAAYGEGLKPVINASGYIAGVHVLNSRHIEVRDIEITGDGGAMVDGSPEGNRYGVYLNCWPGNSVSHITVDNLFIHDIYPAIGTSSEGATSTTYMGTGIGVNGQDRNLSGNLIIRNCRIERMGFKAIELRLVSFVEVLDNDMKDIGGPAIQPGRVNDLVVRGNVVDGSGSFIDPRMHGRGSGIWPWTCDRVLIEKNTFMHARGRADSCGIHIDFNCRDVIVQYNLSIDNGGGFIEILGNNYNCTYRYNISINDGARVKGEPSNGPGTLANNQDGHVIWISGYVGSGNTPVGPFNSYLYNNTVYVKGDIRSTFSVNESALGLLVANNIFYLEGPAVDITSDAFDDYTQEMVDHIVWKNNLYQRTGIVPVFYRDSLADPSFTDSDPKYGNPLFANAGGLLAENYIPQAEELITDRGIQIQKLPDDIIGLRIGLDVAEDFFGNPVIGLPDMGAVELGGTPLPLPEAAFAQVPAVIASGAVSMTAVTGPLNTEYYFTEVSGNFGGNDSGWQLEPTYADDGLLPNTTYAYRVTLRDAMDQAGAPGATQAVTTPPSSPYVEPLILFEDFASVANPVNEGIPFPVQTWYVAYEQEAQESSVNVINGSLRPGWGYDSVMVLWQSGRTLDPDQDYRFSGEWEIANTLDQHLGIEVGIGEFDPATGNLIQQIKQVTVGELLSPVIGQTGTFSLNLSSAELVAAGVTGANRVGLFIEHPGSGTPLRNDVYLVDNLELLLPEVPVDTDGDGIPDSVEPGLGLDPDNPADGVQDPDGDGRSNFSEFLSGSDPNNANDFLALTIFLPSGLPELLLPGKNVLPDRLYILEQSPDLESWTAVDALNGDAAAGFDQTFQIPASTQKDFFRLRVEWD
ncbi:MAG: right-handed parallel beta-helix repeat-containing protein [Puniceicoccaceae bacterium]